MAKSNNKTAAAANANPATDTAQNSKPVDTAANTTPAPANTGTSATATATTAARSVTPATGLKGTVAELVAGGVKLNGHLIDANLITNLRKFHMNSAMSVAGYAPKAAGTKGKSAEIVELHTVPGFTFEAGAVATA